MTAVKKTCYRVKVPPTRQYGTFEAVYCASNERAALAQARRDYNDGRAREGMRAVGLPRGTRVTKETK